MYICFTMVFPLSRIQYFQCIKKWCRRKSFFQLIHQVICILSNFHPRFHICSLSSDFMAFPIDNELKAVNKISEQFIALTSSWYLYLYCQSRAGLLPRRLSASLSVFLWVRWAEAYESKTKLMSKLNFILLQPGREGGKSGKLKTRSSCRRWGWLQGSRDGNSPLFIATRV